MWSEGNLKISDTFHHKANGMHEYNQGLRNPNKRTPNGSKLDAQAIGGG
jgi:hypothetical protein